MPGLITLIGKRVCLGWVPVWSFVNISLFLMPTQRYGILSLGGVAKAIKIWWGSFLELSSGNYHSLKLFNCILKGDSHLRMVNCECCRVRVQSPMLVCGGFLMMMMMIDDENVCVMCLKQSWQSSYVAKVTLCPKRDHNTKGGRKNSKQLLEKILFWGE